MMVEVLWSKYLINNFGQWKFGGKASAVKLFFLDPHIIRPPKCRPAIFTLNFSDNTRVYTVPLTSSTSRSLRVTSRFLSEWLRLRQFWKSLHWIPVCLSTIAQFPICSSSQKFLNERWISRLCFIWMVTVSCQSISQPTGIAIQHRLLYSTSHPTLLSQPIREW